jgi:hypothetical protein
MGLKSGDKAKYYRERRKKHARRAAMRALRATLKGQVTEKAQTPAAT